MFLTYDKTLCMDLFFSEGEDLPSELSLVTLVLFLVILYSNWRGSERQKSTGQERAVGKVIIKLFNSWACGIEGNFMVPNLLVMGVADLTKHLSNFGKSPRRR